MRTLLAALLLAAPALAAPTLAAAQTDCDPRQAATLTPQLSAQFRPASLAGRWTIQAWVSGEGVPDTVIAGTLELRPRVPGVRDSATVRAVPLIGSSTLGIEYVPGIEPFRTPVDNRSDRHPGVELRRSAQGAMLVFGNPTVLDEQVITLQPPVYAAFALMTAFPDAFAGRWELLGQRNVSASGGFCAVRER